MSDSTSVLYLKGSNLPGQEKKQPGDCIKGHRVLMIVKLKNLENVLKIHFVDEKKKQTDDDFKNVCSTMLPVLVHRGFEYKDADEIAFHLEKMKDFTDPSLESSDVEATALAATATPMSSLVGWIKNKDPKKEESLAAKFYKSLGEIDHTLGKKEGPFLCGEDLKFPDCILLPKLYHAKVAALYIKGYDFTKSDPRDPDNKLVFKNIANYLKAAQGNSAFNEACPTEEEIQEKWREIKENRSKPRIS